MDMNMQSRTKCRGSDERALSLKTQQTHQAFYQHTYMHVYTFHRCQITHNMTSHTSEHNAVPATPPIVQHIHLPHHVTSTPTLAACALLQKHMCKPGVPLKPITHHQPMASNRARRIKKITTIQSIRLQHTCSRQAPRITCHNKSHHRHGLEHLRWASCPHITHPCTLHAHTPYVHDWC
jgi:hypothetical protein